MSWKRIALLLLSLLLGFSLTPSQARAEMTLAVTDFRAVGCPFYLGGAVAEQLRGRLSEEPSWIVVEKAQISAVAAEQRLNLSGLVDDETAVKVGRHLGARYVLVGAVNATGGLYTLSARLVDVESAVALMGFETTSNDGQEGLFEASRTLAEQIVLELTGS